jgi:hypothetical protein
MVFSLNECLAGIRNTSHQAWCRLQIPVSIRNVGVAEVR